MLRPLPSPPGASTGRRAWRPSSQQDTHRGNDHLPKRPPPSSRTHPSLPAPRPSLTAGYSVIAPSVRHTSEQAKPASASARRTLPRPTEKPQDPAPQSFPAGAAPATHGLHLGQPSGPCGLEHPTGPSPPSAHPPGTDTSQIIHFKTQGDPVPKAGGSQILLALCLDGRPLSFSLECGTKIECPPAMLSTETGCTGPARALGKIRENSLTSDFSSALSKSLNPVHFHNLDTMRSAFPVHNSSTDRGAHTPASLLRKALQKPPPCPHSLPWLRSPAPGPQPLLRRHTPSAAGAAYPGGESTGTHPPDPPRRESPSEDEDEFQNFTQP